jgi:nitrite reductase/ring-hydroxylating ferredoxin subunit
MPLTRVASLSDIPPGRMFEFRRGDDRYLICNVDGTLHAIDGTCPHRGGPFSQGALHGHSVVCPWHAWEFDCRTGAYDYNPALRVDTFPVTIDGDGVYLNLP